jgi:hypothetical protein
MAERTRSKAASSASKTLATSSSKKAKTVAASALAQANRGTTGRNAAKAASEVIGDRRFTKAARSAAGSTLTQVEKSTAKKK